jgi:hypothetical protein
LRSFGKLLAADRNFQRVDDDGTDDADEDENKSSSIIEVWREPSDTAWKVRVRDSIGAIRLGDVQLIVQPKISLDHFSFIASMALTGGNLKMLDKNLVNISAGNSYFDALANAYLELLEEVLRFGLMVEYVSFEDQLTFARGKIIPVRTAINFLKGVARFDCKFEEFSVDNPLNRILRAAALNIAKSPVCNNPRIQRKGSQLAFRFSGVGELRPTDIYAKEGRISDRLKFALRIAREVLGGNLREINNGNMQVSSFLQYTPGIIEQGIRQILSSGLNGWVSVVKKREYAVKGTVSFNPDLVFIEEGISVSVDRTTKGVGRHIATGDVKYRVESKWNKSTLNQAVAFAESVGVQQGIVVSFRGVDDPQLPSQKLKGGVTIHSSTWVDDESSPPSEAAKNLCISVAGNLGSPDLVIPINLVAQHSIGSGLHSI